MTESRVDQWKRKLLDLSLRNPLLNAKDGLKFLPIKTGGPQWGATAGTEIVPYTPPSAGGDIPFQTLLDEKEIRRRLKELYLSSRSIFNETGVNSLFLAVGFLNWNEAEGEEFHRAPLLLIPAQLIRQTAAPGFRLQRTDEDAVVNFCIVELLRSQFGIPVKDVECEGDGEPDFKEVFKVFADAIQDRKGWSVSSDVALGIFSFAKVVIWKDLNDHFAEFKKQPFVAHLSDGTGIYDDHVTIFPQGEVEKHVRRERLYCPLSADSSQLAAVLYSEKGKSFVLHGPPGTGKSQTITNIIAHNLALGKRVLFVSEKKAALDVVFKRLSSCGLAPFCLELHSNKADKANVMRQFSEALAVVRTPAPSAWESKCANLTSALEEVAGYVRDLHSPVKSGVSAFDCITRHVSRHPQADPGYVSFDPALTPAGELEKLKEAIRLTASEWKEIDRGSYEALRIVHPNAWSPNFQTRVENQIEALLTALSTAGGGKRFFAVLWETVKSRLEGTLDYPFFRGASIEQRTRLLNAKNNLGGLRNILAYRVRKESLAKGRCRKLIDAMEHGCFPSDDAVKVFEDSCSEKVLNNLISQSSALSGFSGKKQERRISRLRELEEEWRDLSREMVVSRLSAKLCEILHPSEGGGETGGNKVGAGICSELMKELAVIKRECEKKKRFMPIRKTLSETKNLSKLLKPCFLMSPLSVAQYLPVDGDPFDLIVFDEASQMTVWDAVGVIARGKQLIVVGDPKQLPPTNFFIKGDVKDEDREDDPKTEDLESILDECLANGLHSAYLNWHYRSRHESLIAFSNHYYYDDKLNTFPAALTSERLGVSFEYVDGALYDHITHTNRKEAESLVAYLFERLNDPVERNRSWGIVTFSVAQQRLIEDLISASAKEREWGAEFFDESKPDAFFVKNLENVQGDERDVIMFSVAYAPDEQGRFAMSFGPVNRVGGERRLNVAITRAREQVVVFSSVRGADIHAERTNSIGVKHLKALMEYAETGRIGEAGGVAGACCAEGVKESICRFLQDKGYKTVTDVGRSNYPVDIAICDKTDPNRYLAGIECDGETYARQATVGDRDLLRGDVLKALGWKVIRVWSMDWAYDRENAEKRLLDALANNS